MLPTLAGWGILFLCIFLIRYFLVQSYRISTSSMQENLQPGDYVLVNKFHTKNNPGRNRPVLFRSPLVADSIHPPLFISRCVGMPGDTVVVTPDGFRINHVAFPYPPQALLPYLVTGTLTDSFSGLPEQLKIPRRLLEVREDGLHTVLTPFEEYMIREELTDPLQPCLARLLPGSYSLILPRRGQACRLDPLSLHFYKEAILAETGEKAEFREGKLFLEGKETSFFFFSQDYYWLLADNIPQGVDSRYVGIIPEDHIVGTIWWCWYSKDKNRIFKTVR